MLEEIIGSAVMYLICLAFIINIAVYSLTYHVVVSHASVDAVKLFLQSLPKYLKPFYEGDRPMIARILQADPSNRFIEEMINTKKRSAQFYRVFDSLIPLFAIFVWIYRLTYLNGGRFVADLTLIALLSVSLFKAWRFGHNVKDFEVQPQSDVNR